MQACLLSMHRHGLGSSTREKRVREMMMRVTLAPARSEVRAAIASLKKKNSTAMPALAEAAALEQRAVFRYQVLAVQDGAASTHPTAVHLTMQTSNRQTSTTQNVAEMAAFPPFAGHRESLQDKRAHFDPADAGPGNTGRGKYRDTTMQVG